MSVFINRLAEKTEKICLLKIYSFNTENSKFIDDSIFLKKIFIIVIYQMMVLLLFILKTLQQMHLKPNQMLNIL